jgi:hypothetical protein
VPAAAAGLELCDRDGPLGLGAVEERLRRLDLAAVQVRPPEAAGEQRLDRAPVERVYVRTSSRSTSGRW